MILIIKFKCRIAKVRTVGIIGVDSKTGVEKKSVIENEETKGEPEEKKNQSIKDKTSKKPMTKAKTAAKLNPQKDKNQVPSSVDERAERFFELKEENTTLKDKLMNQENDLKK